MISLAYEYWLSHIRFTHYLIYAIEKLPKSYDCEMKVFKNVMVKTCGYWG